MERVESALTRGKQKFKCIGSINLPDIWQAAPAIRGQAVQMLAIVTASSSPELMSECLIIGTYFAIYMTTEFNRESTVEP
ncbi:hypothetical protein V6N13_092514 [Hibiscus sabdariffa]|uniref:Uncharacterized protein n=1 Tax=Hibiscus sabdariffa TaxID=183260 RepID=A0ABR2CCJ8_9ROSI